jgi:hypothetical protein
MELNAERVNEMEFDEIEIDEASRGILLDCAEDYVGLWVVIREVRRFLPSEATDAEVRDRTLRVLRQLLEANLIQAGLPRPDGTKFDSWNLSADDTIERIAQEWETLIDEPNIGDIVWFWTTEDGDHMVGGLSSPLFPANGEQRLSSSDPSC